MEGLSNAELAVGSSRPVGSPRPRGMLTRLHTHETAWRGGFTSTALIPPPSSDGMRRTRDTKSRRDGPRGRLVSAPLHTRPLEIEFRTWSGPPDPLGVRLRRA